MIKDMISYVRSWFCTPSVAALALRELEESRRKLLEAQSAREYSDSMCKYYQSKIKRLSAFLR